MPEGEGSFAYQKPPFKGQLMLGLADLWKRFPSHSLLNSCKANRLGMGYSTDFAGKKTLECSEWIQGWERKGCQGQVSTTRWQTCLCLHVSDERKIGKGYSGPASFIHKYSMAIHWVPPPPLPGVMLGITIELRLCQTRPLPSNTPSSIWEHTAVASRYSSVTATCGKALPISVKVILTCRAGAHSSCPPLKICLGKNQGGMKWDLILM